MPSTEQSPRERLRGEELPAEHPPAERFAVEQSLVETSPVASLSPSPSLPPSPSILGGKKVWDGAAEDAPFVLPVSEPLLEVQRLCFGYGNTPALQDITMAVPRNKVTAFIGPSGCGKSTLLRCFNRMNDLVDTAQVSGKILLEGVDVLEPSMDVIALRRRVGMVFQHFNPFPKSIFENVVYGLRIAGVRERHSLLEAAERSLRSAALWDEVKDRLHHSAIGLSGGQMQRLCIARAIAVNPEMILMDEPCSALDPIATARIEELIHAIKRQYTVVIVTHNMQQAARVADYTAFLYLGRLIEFDKSAQVFTDPNRKKTQDYITGRFG